MNRKICPDPSLQVKKQAQSSGRICTHSKAQNQCGGHGAEGRVRRQEEARLCRMEGSSALSDPWLCSPAVWDPGQFPLSACSSVKDSNINAHLNKYRMEIAR